MDEQRDDDRGGGIRASDAERDQTIALLRRHLVDGRLSWEEFSQRMEAASQARTRQALRAVLDDLPPLHEPGEDSSGRAGGWHPAFYLPLVPVALLGAGLLGVWALSALAFGWHHAGRPFFPFFPFFPLWPLLVWWLIGARFARRGPWRRWPARPRSGGHGRADISV